jgi:hypothetical protein
MPLATIIRFRMISPTQVVMKWSLNVKAKFASPSNRDDIGLKG